MSQAHALKQNRLLGIYYRLIEIMNLKVFMKNTTSRFYL